MRKLLSVFFCLSCVQAHAYCNLSQFRWECELKPHVTPTHRAHSLIMCGNSYVYVTKAQYDILVRYQRANVKMNLNLDDEYADSPCIPMRR